jgi:ribose 5-phosphate isomerase A
MSETVGDSSREHDKQVAAEAAAYLVEPGWTVGLGTGTTVAYLLPALARRAIPATYVATSPATEAAARKLGLYVRSFAGVDQLDIAIDGADQVDTDGWLVKGGGGAQTREKIVAASARQFVVIVSADKIVDQVHSPIPVEVAGFGAEATLGRLAAFATVRRRSGSPTPDGGIEADLWVDAFEPGSLAKRLDGTVGVVSHGLFGPEMTHSVLIGSSTGVACRSIAIRPTVR